MLPNTVVLLTDFGQKDHYVGVVKGRILKEVNQAFSINFIDLTHQIPPQDVKKASLLLYFSYKYFPQGTIFLCIVDPGVGTERRALVVKTSNYIFVGPDNGSFSLIYQELQDFEAFEILPEKALKPPFSSTFHGRDLFAPAVAFLLLKKDLLSFTKPISKDSVVKINFPPPQKIPEGYILSVWYVDYFGNLITNFSKELAQKPFKVLVNEKEVPLVKSYGYAKKGELIALFGSENLLEIAINQGSAYQILGYPKIKIVWI